MQIYTKIGNTSSAPQDVSFLSEYFSTIIAIILIVFIKVKIFSFGVLFKFIVESLLIAVFKYTSFKILFLISKCSGVIKEYLLNKLSKIKSSSFSFRVEQNILLYNFFDIIDSKLSIISLYISSVVESSCILFNLQNSFVIKRINF